MNWMLRNGPKWPCNILCHEQKILCFFRLSMDSFPLSRLSVFWVFSGTFLMLGTLSKSCQMNGPRRTACFAKGMHRRDLGIKMSHFFGHIRQLTADNPVSRSCQTRQELTDGRTDERTMFKSSFHSGSERAFAKQWSTHWLKVRYLSIVFFGSMHFFTVNLDLGKLDRIGY